MEDALVQVHSEQQKFIKNVLILVLMEDALVQLGQKAPENKAVGVLILVLMEDALVLECTRTSTQTGGVS